MMIPIGRQYTTQEAALGNGPLPTWLWMMSPEDQRRVKAYTLDARWHERLTPAQVAVFAKILRAIHCGNCDALLPADSDKQGHVWCEQCLQEVSYGKRARPDISRAR